VRRVFIVVWLALTVAGALDHTIAESLFGRRFDLWLPHLKYGHVMFNRNPRTATLFYYAGADGVRHDLADLMPTPAWGYRRARLAISYMTNPDYLKELCLRAHRDAAFIVEEVGETNAVHQYRCENGRLQP
jgi:hypothetical protein